MQRSKELPNIIFCKTKDETDKINVLYKNSSMFRFINGAIPTYFTNDDEKEIINEIKIWYGSNSDTFLDSVISKYHAESTHIKQLCVPIKGEEWSIIDVKVDVYDFLQVLGENRFLQRIIF